jgi:two-component system, cell cycle sensor histidine kinase PleC
MNLGANAIRFSDAGAQVVLKAVLLPDGTSAIRIDDQGQGMSPEEVALAMTPFGQVRGGLDRPIGGTGLGLPIAARLVELHGGTLSIGSAQGKGTSVTIMLPGPVRQHAGTGIPAPADRLAG